MIISCRSYQKINFLSHKTTYSISIPNGYRLVTLVGGHNEVEKQFIYSDSSKIYISDFGCSSLNYSNIRSLGDSVFNKQCSDIDFNTAISNEIGKEYKPPISIILGISSDSLYWKDVKSGYINVGYKNVSKIKRLMFDDIIYNLKTKNNP